MAEADDDLTVAQALSFLEGMGLDDAALDADAAAAATFAERLCGCGLPVPLSGDLGCALGAGLPDGLWCLCEPETVLAAQALDVAAGAEAAVAATRAPLGRLLHETADLGELQHVARVAGRLAQRAPAPFAVGAVNLADCRALAPGAVNEGVRALCAGFKEAGLHGVLVENVPNGAVGYGAVRAAQGCGLPVAALCDWASVPDGTLRRLAFAALAAAGASCVGASSVPWEALATASRSMEAEARRLGVSGAVVARYDGNGAPVEWPGDEVRALGLLGVTGAPPRAAASLWASLSQGPGPTARPTPCCRLYETSSAFAG